MQLQQLILPMCELPAVVGCTRVSHAVIVVSFMLKLLCCMQLLSVSSGIFAVSAAFVI